MTTRALVLLAALSACAAPPDVGVGIAVTPDSVSPRVSVSGGGVSLGAGAGGLSAGLSAGILGISLSD
jgi:hypothetical protein